LVVAAADWRLARMTSERIEGTAKLNGAELYYEIRGAGAGVSSEIEHSLAG